MRVKVPWVLEVRGTVGRHRERASWVDDGGESL